MFHFKLLDTFIIDLWKKKIPCYFRNVPTQSKQIEYIPIFWSWRGYDTTCGAT